MHRVAVLALDQVIAFDLAIPCQVFGGAITPEGLPAYEVVVCAEGDVTATNGPAAQFTLKGAQPLDAARHADTVVVPGISSYLEAPSPAVLELLGAVAGAGTRIASICTGAFVLAAAGLLDGAVATTHWERAGELAQAYPSVKVDAGVLFVDNDGSVLTSAGLSAGIDLCLYLVEMDFGAATAADTARRMVVPMVRDGGQAQFIVHRQSAADGATLAQTLEWMERHLDEPLTLRDIAAHTMTSVRSLNRRFREEVGTTPLQWLLAARVQRAKELLETTEWSVDRIASEVGLGQAVNLRQHFTRRVGVPPQRYRSAFRAGRPAAIAG